MEQHADENFIKNLPERTRVSAGSAIILELLEGKLDAEPTTTYLMTYKTGKCAANCGFCPQARTSLSKAELLSRITWPTFHTKGILKGIENAVNDGKIRRVCIQTLNYPNIFSLNHKLINLFQRADLLRRRAEKLNNLFHGQSVLNRFNSYNFGAELDYNYTTATKHPQTAQLSRQSL
jgi:hypothetical protein